jgi:hypothetical protein
LVDVVFAAPNPDSRQEVAFPLSFNLVFWISW